MGLTGPDEHVSIAHCKGFIDIDRVLACGVSSQRLGCLRLEDMKGFYLIEISRPATMAGSFVLSANSVASNTDIRGLSKCHRSVYLLRIHRPEVQGSCPAIFFCLYQ